MAADSVEDSGLSPLPNPEVEMPKGVLEELPWLDNAIERVQFLRGTVDETYGIARSRASEIGYTSSAHLQQSIANLREIVGDATALYAHYEAVAFGKLKGGNDMSSRHPRTADHPCWLRSNLHQS